MKQLSLHSRRINGTLSSLAQMDRLKVLCPYSEEIKGSLSHLGKVMQQLRGLDLVGTSVDGALIALKGNPGPAQAWRGGIGFRVWGVQGLGCLGLGVGLSPNFIRALIRAWRRCAWFLGLTSFLCGGPCWKPCTLP